MSTWRTGLNYVNCSNVTTNAMRIYLKEEVLILNKGHVRFMNRECQPKSATLQQLLQPIQCKCEDTRKKITVVGVGQVGMAAVITLLTKNITNNLAMVDMSAEKLNGELWDLQHGSVFLDNAKLQAGTDYSITADSKICVVTAGVRQKEGETRLDLVQRNADVLKSLIPKLMHYSPETIFIIATNPCDVMTFVTWKICGLPFHSVLGSGTTLDSARFRFMLAQRLGIAPTSCKAYIIGEHGDTSGKLMSLAALLVAVWSAVDVGGVRLIELNSKFGHKNDPENWAPVHNEVVSAAYKVIKAKGFTSWAIGLSLAEICRIIINNSNAVLPVTTNVKGHYGITGDVFLSLPCTLGALGISDIVKIPLAASEIKALRHSAETLAKIQSIVKF